MFKIVITGSNLPHKDEEAKLFEDIGRVVVAEPENKGALLELVKDAHAILTDTTILDEEVFRAAGALKVVVEYGIGVDNIDLAAATRHGVMVCNVPDAMTREVAEHTLGLILALCRWIPAATLDVTQNACWDFQRYEPRLLLGSTLGLVGFGRIGKTVADFAVKLGMNVLGFMRESRYPEARALGVKPVSLDQLLRESDMVSIHLPLTEETEGLVGEEALGKMKRGAYLINVSRGAIIDEEALARALDEGKIGGAAMDVLREEKGQTGHPLFGRPNVIITPHMGWCSEKAAMSIEMGAAQEAKNVLLGKAPRNLVNKEVLAGGQ